MNTTTTITITVNHTPSTDPFGVLSDDQIREMLDKEVARQIAVGNLSTSFRFTVENPSVDPS